MYDRPRDFTAQTAHIFATPAELGLGVPRRGVPLLELAKALHERSRPITQPAVELRLILQLLAAHS